MSSSSGINLFSEVDVDSKLKSVCPNVQLKEVPAINQKRIVTFVNHFTINMVEYLNKFAQTCQQRLYLCDEKIQKLEDEMSLLEAKLNSIPETCGVQVPPETIKPSSVPEPEPVKEDVVSVDGTEDCTSGSTGESSATAAPRDTDTEEVATASSEPDPAIAKYLKMVQFGVPRDAVRLKMRAEGVDPSLLPS